jgi:hypothetical protein
MNFTALEKRIRTLETVSIRQRLDKRSACRLAPLDSGTASWVKELEELTQEARTMTDEARTAGDLRTALASIRVRCCIVELAATLTGDLEERGSTNIVNVNLDSETAQRIAEVYLARHKALKGESK